jgi:hypothetical protein
MLDAKWGVMTHYLADWIDPKMTIEKWNQLIDNFDVSILANQLKSVGAGYHILSLGQNSGFYLCPNAAYDRITGIKPSKLSNRCLILDMAKAQEPLGIKMMVYLPSGAPDEDSVAMKALNYTLGPYPNIGFQNNWQEIITEWSKTFGTNTVGWWFDGVVWPNIMYRSPTEPNFGSFAAAGRSGNPNSAVCFNPGVTDRDMSVTPEEDYTCGELDYFDRLLLKRIQPPGYVDGVKVHFMSYLGQTWAHSPPRFTTQQAVADTLEVTSQKGTMTWDVPVDLNGTIPEEFMVQLRAIGQAVKNQVLIN